MKFKDLEEPVQDLAIFLLILSLPVEKQIEIHGIGHPGLEMPVYIQYDMGYQEDIKLIKEKGLLSSDTISTIETFISGLPTEEIFWMNFDTLLEWNELRKAASLLIKAIGLEELEIITQFNKIENGQGIVESVSVFVIIEKDRSEAEFLEAVNKYKEEK